MNKLSQLAAAALEKNSDDPAIEFEGRWYSWNEVNALANRLTGLIDDCGGPANGPIVFIARSQAASIAALAEFKNVKRRMEVRGRVAHSGGDITVYDDFAHHPTAIRTTLDGLRRQLGSTARILAAFEPRSNTMKLGAMKAQLPWSLEDADLAFCHAGGLDWDARAALDTMGPKAQVADSIDALLAQLLAAAQPGDHILCMSNGGFGDIHRRLLQSL